MKPIVAELVWVTDGDERYQCLKFVCPGCVAGGRDNETGLHLLPVNCATHTPSWTFDGNLEAPTLSPSILTKGGPGMSKRCHSFLEHGLFRFLTDSTHPLAGREQVPMPALPSWALND